MTSTEPMPDPLDAVQAQLLQLQASTQADVILVGEVLSSPVPRVRSVYCCAGDQWQSSFSYLLGTHPCQQVLHAQEFQHLPHAATDYPQAFLLADHGVQAYAAYPFALDGASVNGILVVLSRRAWKDPKDLREQLAAVAQKFMASEGTLSDVIKHKRLAEESRVKDEFFKEFVLSNSTGISLSEFMPPVPLTLPEDQLLQRLMYTGFVVDCNAAMARMYGYADRAALMGARPLDVNGPEKAPRAVGYWMRENYVIRDAESQAVDSEGNITWMKGTVLGKVHEGKLIHFWTKRSDITSEKRYETAMLHKVHHDALTELPNRYWFQERMATLIADHRTRNKRLCVGLLDLNGFKEINDTLGHGVGDLLLQAISKRLLHGLKPHDAELARLGGDEFAILMPEVNDTERAHAMVKALQRLLAEPFVVADLRLPVDGSLGLVMFPDWSDTGEDLLRLADVAMYAAKNSGQAFQWYRPEIDFHSKRRLSLFTSLGSAIEAQEMVLTYQPKVDVQSGHVLGVEALVRWQHPSLGLIPPADFVPFAETSEVIKPLTRWVLDEAIRQGGAWRRSGRAMKMAVNISVRNLLDDQLEGYVLECLARHDFPAALLELEITESALMTRPGQAMHILHALRAHGVSIAIDDFGTGYSSLAYLARLPVTTLKVDQSFVKDMSKSTMDAQIVRSIIGLAHQCRLTVVAEGVEDTASLQALRHMGCDLAQGYFIARPMDGNAVMTWVNYYEAHPELR